MKWFLVFIVILLILCGCTNMDDVSTQVKFSISELHNGDAKFYRDVIVTGVDGWLNIIDMDGNILRSFDGEIRVNWIDSWAEEGIIVYGNFNNEIGIVVLDDEYDLISSSIIMKTENLQIDPTINKVGDKFYLTTTEIAGTVNNADPELENGWYWIHLYVSTDLKTWTYVSDIDYQQNNLEDVDVLIIDNTFYVTYEREEYDKGNSSVLMRYSEDRGLTWSDSIELLGADCDHEPTCLLKKDNEWILYYSCDKDEVGSSYEGGKAFYAVFDEYFELITKDMVIPTATQRGILWYDYQTLNDKEYFLFAKDYFTTNDMVVEWR